MKRNGRGSRQAGSKDSTPRTAARTEKPTRSRVAKGDVSRSHVIARKLAQVAPDEDPARVAGAIVIFATETIKRSAKTLPEARAYLDGLRTAIEGLLQNAFSEKDAKKP
jgi:hypothetical protein